MRWPSVYIVVLNYNGLEDTIECVDSLKKLEYTNYQIVLVDNCSTDESATRLKEIYPEYYFIKTERNFGYAGGNNAGIKYALKQSADYICILNNDVVVEPDFLDFIIKEMENDYGIGITGPKICEYDDKSVIQSTGSKISLYTGRVPAINAGKKCSDFQDSISVDYIGGACLVIRSSLIEEIGLIPEIYFLFFEETEWCLKAKRNKNKIVCVCQSRVYHKGSVSIAKIKGLKAYYMTRNNFLFIKRNALFIQKIVFTAYITLRLSMTFIKGLITGRFNMDIYRGFIDGIHNRTGQCKKYGCVDTQV